MTTNDSWRARAACRDKHPDLFFPVSDANPNQAAIQQAKDVCDSCPVTGQCLQWALDNRIPHGIWGGLTKPERDRLRRSRRRPSRAGSSV